MSWKGPGLDLPAVPVQWRQALRPLANCLGTPLAVSEAPDVAQAGC